MIQSKFGLDPSNTRWLPALTKCCGERALRLPWAGQMPHCGDFAQFDPCVTMITKWLHT